MSDSLASPVQFTSSLMRFPLASFFLSTAMRVGPGNILGVTGAISVGGPGALFWMWISAFFGMATAYTESTLAQIFKEKKDDEYIGGLAFYGKRFVKNSTIVGVFFKMRKHRH